MCKRMCINDKQSKLFTQSIAMNTHTHTNNDTYRFGSRSNIILKSLKIRLAKLQSSSEFTISPSMNLHLLINHNQTIKFEKFFVKKSRKKNSINLIRLNQKERKKFFTQHTRCAICLSAKNS